MKRCWNVGQQIELRNKLTYINIAKGGYPVEHFLGTNTASSKSLRGRIGCR